MDSERRTCSHLFKVDNDSKLLGKSDEKNLVATISYDSLIDRDAKKSKISERPAEFRVHSRDNSKNFLLKSF